MSEFLLHYRPVAPTTWAYLSSFLMIGLFLKFHRLWSMRNLDLFLLILLAPGLLVLHYGYTLQRTAGRTSDTRLATSTRDTPISSHSVGNPAGRGK